MKIKAHGVSLISFFFLAEEGGLYVFYGGTSFPLGNATRGCKEVEPCPGEKVISTSCGVSPIYFEFNYPSILLGIQL